MAADNLAGWLLAAGSGGQGPPVKENDAAAGPDALDALRGSPEHADLISACLARHGLPRTPADLGLSHAEFVKAVAFAPCTRPGRYPILERLALSETEIADRVEEYTKAVAS